MTAHSKWTILLVASILISIVEGYYIIVQIQKNDALQETVITKEVEISNLKEILDINKGVSVKLDNSHYTDKNAILTITNYGPNAISFGSQYKIERKEVEIWVEVSPFPPISAWTAELNMLKPGKSSNYTIKIDTLAQGEYRVSKTIKDEATQKNITFILEFEIS